MKKKSSPVEKTELVDPQKELPWEVVDVDFLNNIGMDTHHDTESQSMDIQEWWSGLVSLEEDLDMIVSGLRMEPAEVDREYVYGILHAYSNYIPSMEMLVNEYVTQFQWVDMELLKKSIFILGYTERQVLDTDTKVIINEMVELAKRFGWYETYKLVNSIFHKLMIHTDE